MADELTPAPPNNIDRPGYDPDHPLRDAPQREAPWYIDRAWEHAIHEDELFHGHLDVLLVFESLLLAGVSALSGSAQAPAGLAPALAAFGLLSCGYWMLVQRRARFILFHLANALEEDPYYQEIARARQNPKYPRYLRSMKNWSMLGYGLPIGVALLWTIILVFLLMDLLNT